jgi:polysaccharide biosynthesis protein PslJ
MTTITFENARGAGVAAERRLFTWPRAVVTLVAVIWLIPIKSYAFPVKLPFNLEPYRLLIMVMAIAWVIAALSGRARFSAAGHGRPIAAMVLVAIIALVANRTAIDAAGMQTQAIKSFSFFISYSVAYLLVSSTIARVRDVDSVIKMLAIGAVIVAAEAIYESRTKRDLFDDLHHILPFLVHIGPTRQNFAGGHLRVRASAQHPIALGAALAISAPLVLYVASRAATRLKRYLWFGATVVILMGAMATESRTVILALIVMLLMALRLRGRRLVRYWPALLVLVALTHVAAPGVVSHLYKRFNPKGGLVHQQQVRAGLRGSGRLADLKPGLERWSKAPLFGYGIGTVAATGDKLLPGQQTGAPGVSTIYDDQYMNTLISIGLIGLIAVLWFVWGSAAKLASAARKVHGEAGDLLSACAIAATGFAASMFTFDAFSFVQVTLLFFIISAVGLRARAAVLG